MKSKFLRLKWRAWEYILIVTEWLFGYGHEVSYGVKNNRNKAYFDYMFSKGKNK